jgi:DNA repair exonuclease SbcCD ATPase subunit
MTVDKIECRSADAVSAHKSVRHRVPNALTAVSTSAARLGPLRSSRSDGPRGPIAASRPGQFLRLQVLKTARRRSAEKLYHRGSWLASLPARGSHRTALDDLLGNATCPSILIDLGTGNLDEAVCRTLRS